MIDVNKMLATIGADEPGNLKVYPANSRLRVFVKASKLPSQPTAELTFDLPGDSEELLATGLNYLINMLRSLKGGANEGNETPQPA